MRVQPAAHQPGGARRARPGPEAIALQTFLPFPDFATSLGALDVKRLGKQRVEVIQIVRALTVPGYAWANHPAVLMWKGHEEALGRYGLIACALWTARGFGDTCAETIRTDLAAAGVTTIRSGPELAAAGALPGWLDDPALLRSHRSALLRKDPEHYGPLFPADTPTDLPYHWPVRSPAVVEREAKRAARAAERAERDEPGAPTAGPRRTARQGAGTGPGRRNRTDPGAQRPTRS